MATNYSYGTATATNGVKLAYIKTSPNNVLPYRLNPTSSVPNSGKYGINGGYFGGSSIYSIAVVNGNAVGTGSYDGSFNARVARGTLIWDPVARAYQVKVISDMSEISVEDTNNYWAQGGNSMCLGKTESEWKTQTDVDHEDMVSDESGIRRDENAYRSGLVYNTGLNIWLVVSTNTCTCGKFRAAILEKIGSNTLVDGIFLDGGGSTQMKCAEVSNAGSEPGRKMPEMVSLINND